MTFPSDSRGTSSHNACGPDLFWWVAMTTTLHFHSLSQLERGASPARVPYQSWLYRHHLKRLTDIIIVIAALPAVLPIMVLIGAALWHEGGNPFYAQKRLGQNGRVFWVWKFRTMVRNADRVLADILASDPALRAEWDLTQKLRHDPRVTRLGRLLRRTSLDELPQLFNVLRGDMSLVGPRPMLPEQLPLYGIHAPSYFALRPGLTGLWQVSERNEAQFLRRAELDAAYERDVTFATDLSLLVATVSVVARGTGC